MTEMTLGKALNEGLRRGMREDEKVVLLGEDIGTLGGVFRITDGLKDEFGAQRVIDTPLAESGIVGTAVGLAFRGYRPVVEIQFDGFIYPAFDQIVSQVAKLHYRTQGHVRMPITIRVPWGGGIGAAEHHSESPEAYFVHTAGLRVVAVSDPDDAYRCLRQAIASDDPVLFFEPKRLYHEKGEVDLEASLADSAPMGVARIVRTGSDVTLIAYGAMVRTALDAAEAAADEGVSLEVIDLRSLSPVDYDTVAAAVRRTGRVVVAHEASREAGLGAEIIASITELCFEYLEAAPMRVTGHDVPYPPAKLERFHLPDLDRILDSVDRVLGRPHSLSGMSDPRGGAAMIAEFRLPDLGEGLTEAEVVQWLVEPGDSVVLNQTVAEVETAKAVVELPSPFEGTVAALHAEPGQTVAVGSPLIAFDVVGTDDAGTGGGAGGRGRAGVPPGEGTGDVGVRPATDDGTEPNLVGYGAPSSAGRPVRRARRGSRPDAGESAVESAVIEAAPHDVIPAAAEPATGERPRSTPPVRAYARRRGVDLALVASDVGDRAITRDDVDAYADRPGTGSRPHVSGDGAAHPSLHGDERAQTRIPVRGVRRRTAEAMVRSAFTAPHVTTFHTVDVTAGMELVARFRADRILAEHRIGPLALVAKAVCLALGRNPSLNAHWDEDAQEIVHHHFVDLGIAVATERGLLVPNIRDAERLSLADLADALHSVVETAREGRTAPGDLTGGTFSISNIGVFGVEAGTPILPPGQSGILAMGAVRRQPWEHRGEIALRQLMTLSLSFDHRLVDGAEGAHFLTEVADLLEEPGRAMLY